MRVDIGPVERASARAWTGWARDMLRALRREPTCTLALPDQVLQDIGSFVDCWALAASDSREAFRWHGDVHPDHLEYLANSLYNLDAQLEEQARLRPARAEPSLGVAFHVVLVEALLFALCEAGPSQAAFADQLRPAWTGLGGGIGGCPSAGARLHRLAPVG